MRFEQLKREPNAILRKKLYKSGKNWIVASTLAFAGGMLFLGSAPGATVKADVNLSVTESQSVAGSSDSSANVKTVSPNNSSDTTNAGNSGASQLNNSDTAKNDNKVAVNASGNTNSSSVDNSNNDSSQTTIPIQKASSDLSATDQASGQQQGVANTDGSDPTSTTTDNAEGIDDPTNITSSKEDGNSNVESGTDEKGSAWYINSQGVLHIEPGTWTNEGPGEFSGVTPFGGYDYFDKVKSLHFDGKVVAGKNIVSLFDRMENLSDLGNMSDEFDTSKTENFEYLFDGTKNLSSYDFSSLNMSNATDVSHMFSSSGIKNVDLSGFDWPKITKYDYMFDGTNNLEKADLSNFNFHIATMQDMFSQSSINEITLSNVNVSNVHNIYQLFMDDPNLVSLDLSDLQLPSDVIDGAFLNNDSGLKSITLNPTIPMSSADLGFDTNLYKGWVNQDKNWASKYYPKDYIYSNNDLAGLYTNEPGNTPPEGNQTWIVVDKDKVNYTINYFTSKQDPTKDKPISVKSGAVVDGTTVDASQYVPDGYVNPNPSEVELDYTNGAEQVVNVVVDQLVPYNLNINVHYEDDPTKDSSSTAALQMNQTDVTKDTGFQSDLDKLPNSNKTLDWDKTTMNLGKLNGGEDTETIADMAGWDNISKDMTSLKDIINAFINFNISPDGNGSALTGIVGGDVPNFVDAYYKTYEAPANNNHHSGGGSSEPEQDNKPSGEAEKIKQTVATFDNHSKVQLYDSEGNAVANEYLNPNTTWYNDKKMELDGTTYYRVSTNRWINANDVYIYTTKDTHVRVYDNNYGDIVDAHGKTLNRALKPSTDWYSDRIVEINGDKYYRVSTNEFVKADNVYDYDYDSPVITTNKVTPVYDERGNVTTTSLPADSSYKTDIYQVINGENYYRIATNEFVKASDINL
ncbi:SLAP domain-containing protein [Companilactobacillus insicii]|uniref:SLAP domain-containing protein n=1 Tax=Companilactobacillus insicii TaxID=1732567 RepID=UPI0013DE2E2B|nr:SLAP domain-containing protein [Companilactobacillus insicii]